MTIYEIVRFNVMNKGSYEHHKGKENKTTARIQDMLDSAYYRDIDFYRSLH